MRWKIKKNTKNKREHGNENFKTRNVSKISLPHILFSGSLKDVPYYNEGVTKEDNLGCRTQRSNPGKKEMQPKHEEGEGFRLTTVNQDYRMCPSK